MAAIATFRQTHPPPSATIPEAPAITLPSPESRVPSPESRVPSPDPQSATRRQTPTRPAPPLLCPTNHRDAFTKARTAAPSEALNMAP